MAVVQRVAVVQRLVQNSRLICSRFSRGGDLDWSLFTGGRCSEVAVVQRFDCISSSYYCQKVFFFANNQYLLVKQCREKEITTLIKSEKFFFHSFLAFSLN